ncbi:MAG TPA: aminomethyltransferase beta-barrel domain-containing protein [Baekduia sp.]|nr:aminomethyltransferase beta-barrel domain-containing protein [Baekduia sp.]
MALRDLRLHGEPDEVEAVKLRYKAAPVACRLEGQTLLFGDSVDGAAPGQVAVLLQGDVVVGCGTISR